MNIEPADLADRERFSRLAARLREGGHQSSGEADLVRGIPTVVSIVQNGGGTHCELRDVQPDGSCVTVPGTRFSKS
jgi:hypothetical protein